MFVTQQYESYIKVVGDYSNKSVPLGSTVNLSCFFDGKYDWGKRRQNTQFKTTTKCDSYLQG